MAFERLTLDAGQMGGVPCFRSLRILVTTVVGLVTQGLTEERIVAGYPDLEVEDIRRALAFAAAAVDEKCAPVSSVCRGGAAEDGHRARPRMTAWRKTWLPS